MRAGDFNATPWSSVPRQLDGSTPLVLRTHALFSWPTLSGALGMVGVRASLAFAPIDHVYPERGLRLTELRRGPNIGSDHYPVIAYFVLARPPMSTH
ncbi:MAG: endonuclease/exonuclease/phosphatase family protein [Alphaproteobacteria bacterium]